MSASKVEKHVFSVMNAIDTEVFMHHESIETEMDCPGCLSEAIRIIVEPIVREYARKLAGEPE